MGAFADLLELLHGAPSRVSTVQGVWREWHHTERALEAFRRSARDEQTRGTSHWVMSYGEEREPPAPPVTETFVRFWIDRSARRFREERTLTFKGREATALLVGDGPRWWSYDPHAGATTNDDDLGHGHGSSIDGIVFEPGLLIPGHVFEIRGEETLIGRRGVRVQVRPQPGSNARALGYYWGDSEPEIVADLERGILLAVRNSIDGEPYAVSDLTELRFDEPIPAERFTFVPPAGEVVRSTGDLHRGLRDLELHDLARLAPFTVLVAPRVPIDWEIRARFMPADERLETPATATILYHANDGRAQIGLLERQGQDAQPPVSTPDGAEWRSVARGAARIRYWTPSDGDMGMPTVAHTAMHGTAVHAHAHGIPLDELLDFVASLAPAPREPPTILGSG